MTERSKTEQEERGSQDELTALIRTGAQKLIAQALKAEVAELLATYADQQDEQGHARVVLSGHHPTRVPAHPDGQHSSLKILSRIEIKFAR